MNDIYSVCPQFENEEYRIRHVEQKDCSDLLLVYSDKKAVPFFNSDNCHGDDFHYITMERMRKAIEFWDREYRNKVYVRWSIISRRKNAAIGTIELFHRHAPDVFDDCIVLRLDLRSDYEKADEITSMMGLILPFAFEMFGGRAIISKAIPAAVERRAALAALGFDETEDVLIGHDKTRYGHYYRMRRQE